MKGGIKMKLNAILVEKISKKGKQYVAIEIQLSENYKKLVFLDSSEMEILRLSTPTNK